nr:MAG: hypothetical protein DIU64_11545 [Caldicoprobacter oshimai]
MLHYITYNFISKFKAEDGMIIKSIKKDISEEVFERLKYTITSEVWPPGTKRSSEKVKNPL